MRADFGGTFSILSYNINRRRSSAAYVADGVLLKNWHKIFSLAGIQQVTWNGREIEKGSFHVFTISLFLPFATEFFCEFIR